MPTRKPSQRQAAASLGSGSGTCCSRCHAGGGPAWGGSQRGVRPDSGPLPRGQGCPAPRLTGRPGQRGGLWRGRGPLPPATSFGGDLRRGVAGLPPAVTVSPHVLTADAHEGSGSTRGLINEWMEHRGGFSPCARGLCRLPLPAHASGGSRRWWRRRVTQTGQGAELLSLRTPRSREPWCACLEDGPGI